MREGETQKIYAKTYLRVVSIQELCLDQPLVCKAARVLRIFPLIRDTDERAAVLVMREGETQKIYAKTHIYAL